MKEFSLSKRGRGIEDSDGVITRYGSVKIIDPVSGKTYIDDVSKCEYGCAYNSYCGTKTQCR